MKFPFVEGVLLGVTLAVIFGPALFTFLQTSIHRGFNAGLLIAAGIVLSDFVIVVLSYLGVAQLIENPQHHVLFSTIGGSMLIIFGLVTYKRKVYADETQKELKIKVPGPATYVFKGFFLNIANPFIWIFWISLMVGISSNYGGNRTSIASFFAGALVMIFSTDFLKVLIAQRIKRFITPKVIVWINRIVGVLLIIFGIALIVRIFIQVDLPSVAHY